MAVEVGIFLAELTRAQHNHDTVNSQCLSMQSYH
jgi:hypothetical protein